MSPSRVPEPLDTSSAHTRSPRSSHNRPPPAPPEVDPTGQSPDAPIEFTSDNDVARGNAERANAEPEPAALHAAEVPGQPDPAQHRRELQHELEERREGDD